MSCTSDIISLAFSFHTPTFFVRVRISWNSWPLFSCWLRLCDVRFRLGSRVCVFVLFCSVVVSFVVGRRQHCRYIVIDAMVYPKNWILEGEFGTGKTSRVFGLNGISTSGFAIEEDFGIWKLQHCAWIDRDEFWMMLHHLFFIGFDRRTVMGCMSLDIFRLSSTIFRSWMWSGTTSIFLRIWSDDPYTVVMWWDEMSCRKGVWKFDTLW